jgi:UDP-GlcNAc:undecaprenyl-phosphate GlcNAc-1-phosphate transferase
LSTISASVIGFVITTALLLVLRPLALRIRLVDEPGGRKSHNGEVPIVGGVAMLGGLLVAAIMGGALGHNGVVVVVASIFVVFVGVLDDLFELAASYRLFAHASAAIALAFGTGYIVPDLGNLIGLGSASLGWLALPFTIISCIALINAFNMLDGLDGLAGGCAMIALAGFFALSVLHGASTSAILAAGLFGACVGFLMFNLPTALNRRLRTFMGDGGSTLLGFLLACIALILVQPAQADIPPVVILWLLPIPIFELFATTIRRLMRGLPAMAADTGHAHYRLLDAGFSVRLIFVIYVLVSTGAAWFGIAAFQGGMSEPILFGLFVATFFVWLAFIRLAPVIGALLPLALRRNAENLPH